MVVSPGFFFIALVALFIAVACVTLFLHFLRSICDRVRGDRIPVAIVVSEPSD
tara:strand:- start:70 stop:228 length:159 start_codon:yes stop_codon:yes gene_type:complete